MTSTKKASAAALCPVCQYKIDDSGRPIEINKRVIIVCCEDCEKKVRENPQKYINGK
jgi:hypothetical protein